MQGHTGCKECKEWKKERRNLGVGVACRTHMCRDNMSGGGRGGTYQKRATGGALEVSTTLKAKQGAAEGKQ